MLRSVRNITVYFDDYHLRDYDFKMAACIFSLSVISTASVYCVSKSLALRQCIGFLTGFLIFIIFSLIRYNFIAKLVWILYIINIGVLFALLFLGVRINGSVRWFSFGALGSLQPSEFAKLVMILFTAVYFGKEQQRIHRPAYLLLAVLLYAVPVILILREPDLSTTLVLAVIFIVMIFNAGLHKKTIIGLLTALVPACGIFLWYVMQPEQIILHDYQKQRILTFLNPKEYLTEGYAQQFHSLIAIGSGKLTGQRFEKSVGTTITGGKYISEPQTDFIFAVIGEQFGFIGGMMTLLLILAIVMECLYIGRHAPDMTGCLIACGVAAWIGFQALVNVGVAMAVLPNTGLPLPFLSYGLSSLFSLMMGAGIVMNIRLQRNRRSF